MAEASFERRIGDVRRFNRFYTRQIGVLHEGLVRSPYSLTEVRVLWELAHRDRPTAAGIGKELGLDAGYLSRILRGFQQRGLVASEPSETDARQNLLRLTEEGIDAYAVLDARSRDDVASLLSRLSEAEQRRLTEAMSTIEALLGAPSESKASYLLRTHQPGDMGWVVARHGVLYAQEYGWDETFEALIAEIVAKFIRELDPKRERCWIAELDGENVGCVFLVKHPEMPERVAKLRLLLVEPTARGLGIGRRLVDECIRFGRQAGYRKITLWTNSVLDAARHIYEQTGFALVQEEPHHSFGHDLIGQTWELEL
ncbi:MAG TPA: helix-turn-helix domain-containing GNAT family N-acetyltransferase [Thermoanaerobaculia bacterium]|nr:helix-turn-helix domain-containing GNAT family N-acetyltransferase [Thermoanaerobaculia bacterium]